MAGPFDYTIQTPDIFRNVAQGYEYGVALTERERERQQQEMLAQQQAQEQARIRQIQQEYMNNPSPDTGAALRFLSTLPPEQAKIAAGMIEKMPAEVQKQNLGYGVQMLAATRAGDFATVKSIAQERAAAARNAGDENAARIFDFAAENAGKDPKRDERALLAGLVQYPGGVEAVNSLMQQSELPGKIAQTEAETKAKTADAKLKEIQARFAPDQIKAELGLTAAQTGQARASAAASYASADSSRANAEQTRKETAQLVPGAVPAGQRPDLEMKLRKEYADQTKTYKDTKESYARVLAAKPDAIGDISLIYGYMKMLDPGSVVREGEYATAENARGVSESVRNLYNKVMTGQRLTDAQRKGMRGQAGKVYEAALKGESTVRKGVERIAKNYGLNTENVFFEEQETPPGVSPAGGGDMPPPGAVRLKGGR